MLETNRLKCTWLCSVCELTLVAWQLSPCFQLEGSCNLKMDELIQLDGCSTESLFCYEPVCNSVVTCAGISSAWNNVGVWGQLLAEVGAHVDLSSISWYHVSGRHQFPENQKHSFMSKVPQNRSLLTLFKNNQTVCCRSQGLAK